MRKRAKASPTTAADFLLEVGVEEMPVGTALAIAEQMRALVPKLLGAAAQLRFDSMEPFVTPRRFGVLVRGLVAREEARALEMTGPSKQVAFDAQGRPTPACLGFLKRHGATLKDLETRETPRGAYVLLRKTQPARSAKEALCESIPELLGNLQLPKSMRWEQHDGWAFIRPVRWLVALHGTAVVPIRFAGLAAGRVSRAHRAAGSRTIRLLSAAGYPAAMRWAGVVTDPSARRQLVQRAIERQIKTGEHIAAECLSEGHAGGISLLDEVAHLVESPVAFRGTCDRQVAELPREIVIASMAKYQRVFAVEGRQGKLLPTFIAVTNGAPRNRAAVRHVYEHILAARLADSHLFYQQDLKTPIESLAPQTAGILVHRQLKSMKDKADRLKHLTSWLADQWHASAEEQQQAAEAAQFCKADLASHVVYEFPSLQGIMGGLYYRHQHADGRVIAEAIQDHYLAHRPVPRSRVGLMLALADRMDTLTGFLGIGIKPTGSTDPFGLRRAANELLALLVVKDAHSLSLSAFIEAAVRQWNDQTRVTLGATVRAEVLAYLRERFEARQDARYDLVRAVLAAGFDDVGDALARIKALEACVRREPKLFVQACKVAERTRNIVRAVKSSDTAAVDPAKFSEPLEREVWEALEQVRPRLGESISQRRYADALQAYAHTFSELLERFFTHVLVNTDESAVRANRLALLRDIDRLISRSVADLTLVVLESPTEVIPA